MKNLVIVVFALLSQAVLADCLPVSISTGNVQVEKGNLPDHSCFVSVRPANVTSSSYREYLFSDQGLLKIKSSYSKTELGTRELYFFPRSNSVDFGVDPRSNEVVVLMANGDRVTFDPRTAELKSMALGQLMMVHGITPNDQGGLEITLYIGLYMDLGQSTAGEPHLEADRYVNFRGPGSWTCTLTVRDMFNPAFEFRFSDAELGQYLKTHCPR